jgi:hypothetical protein
VASQGLDSKELFSYMEGIPKEELTRSIIWDEYTYIELPLR